MREIDYISDIRLVEELKTFPNQGTLWEIIERQITGKIFAFPSNSILVVENSMDPFIWITGDITEEDVATVDKFISKLEFPMLICNAKSHSLFLKNNWNFHLRVELLPTAPLNKYILSNNLELHKIKTSKLFEKCSWHNKILELYGSHEEFFKNGIGYAVCIGDVVVSEAYASIGNSFAELAVVTHPDYRHKGYAALIVSYLSRKLLELGLKPTWSCDVSNKASFSTALKIGFDIERYYTCLVPNFGNVLCKNLLEWVKNNDCIEWLKDNGHL